MLLLVLLLLLLLLLTPTPKSLSLHEHNLELNVRNSKHGELGSSGVHTNQPESTTIIGIVKRQRPGDSAPRQLEMSPRDRRQIDVPHSAVR